MNVVHGTNIRALEPALVKQVNDRADHWRDELIGRMQRAQIEGDFGGEYDARGLALLVKAATEGLLTVAHQGASDDDLQRINKAFLLTWPGR
jgi:hypothetical protein